MIKHVLSVSLLLFTRSSSSVLAFEEVIIHEGVVLADHLQYLLLTGLHDKTAHDEFF